MNTIIKLRNWNQSYGTGQTEERRSWSELRIQNPADYEASRRISTLQKQPHLSFISWGTLD